MRTSDGSKNRGKRNSSHLWISQHVMDLCHRQLVHLRDTTGTACGKDMTCWTPHCPLRSDVSHVCLSYTISISCHVIPSQHHVRKDSGHFVSALTQMWRHTLKRKQAQTDLRLSFANTLTTPDNAHLTASTHLHGCPKHFAAVIVWLQPVDQSP